MTAEWSVSDSGVTVSAPNLGLERPCVFLLVSLTFLS